MNLQRAQSAHGAMGTLFIVLAMVALATPASAAPPTVTPSPGYDRRLQESRSMQAPPPAAAAPVPKVRKKTKTN